MEQNYYIESMVPASEERMILPSRLGHSHNGYQTYLKLPPMEQVHMLDDDTLIFLHHSMREGDPARASHLLTGAWVQIELAQIRGSQGASAEAQELIEMARSQLKSCEKLIEKDYKNHQEFWYFDRLYRTRIASVYVDHFAQLGSAAWPEHPTDFQRLAYGKVQEELVNPLLDDYGIYKDLRDEENQCAFGVVKGLLGELVVLQALNRLQSQQEYNEWSVAPASMRENSFMGKNANTLSSAFDLKLTFADQTFIPIEVKWSSERQRSSYDPSIVFIRANTQALDAVGTAAAMRREVAGETPQPLDSYKIETMTDSILESIKQTGRRSARP